MTFRILLGTTIVLSLSYIVAGQCNWDINPNPGNSETLFCQKHPYEVWCLKTVSYELRGCRRAPSDYNRYQRIDEVYEYNIIINLENPNEDPLFKNLTLYTDLRMLNGYLVTVPKDVFKMYRLTSIRISGNKLRKINFNDFLPLSKLKKLDLGNNTLIVIETSEVNETYSAVLDIDLSLNSIETIPKNFLKNYRELEYLNMSHNMISSIDINAFEGVEQLKTLDLSHNKLKDVENLFAQLPKLVNINYALPQNLQKLSKLVLDENFIDYVNLVAFFETGIPELSIGGNKIPCHILAEVKYSKYDEKFNRIVTAKILDFESKNINGILCEEDQNDIGDVSFKSSSVLISSLIKIIEKNVKSIENLSDIVKQNVKIVDKDLEPYGTTPMYN